MNVGITHPATSATLNVFSLTAIHGLLLSGQRLEHHQAGFAQPSEYSCEVARMKDMVW